MADVQFTNWSTIQNLTFVYDGRGAEYDAGELATHGGVGRR